MEALVVTNPFNGYAVGVQITDAGLIKEIQAGEHAAHVVRTVIDDPPAKPRFK